MPSLSDFFGKGSIGEQLLVWGVLNQLFSAALAPAVADITQAVNEAHPVLPLPPEQLAVGVIRQIIDQSDAASDAAKSGISGGRFTQLLALAQQPPALSLILAAYQRQQSATGAATDTNIDIDAALADLGIETKYWPTIKALAIEIPTAQQVLNAWLEGQIEPDEAQGRLLATGMDPSWIQTAYNSEGQAPTPVEALELWNRGIIAESGTGPDSTSYEQAFLEGPWRNKWLAPFKALRFYVPPPRTVTAMLKEGALTEAQAAQYLADSGLDPTLTAIYISAASHTTTAAQRELTQAQVVDLYESKLITAEQATADLVALKFTAADAQLLLALADQKQAASAVKSAVTRLQNLYLNGTNSAAVTTSALHELGLTDDNVTNLLATWNLEQSARIKTLTAAEIAGAFYYGIMTQATAEQKLVALGYSLQDADIVLAVRTHALLPGQVAL